MSFPVANVALTDTFQTWVNKTNQVITNVNQVNKSAFTLTANAITVNTATTSAATSTIGPISANSTLVRISSAPITSMLSSNTNIQGGTLLVTSNTNFTGTVQISGTNLADEDTAVQMAIALG